MSLEDRLALKEKEKAGGMFGNLVPKIPGVPGMDDEKKDDMMAEKPKEEAPASPKAEMWITWISDIRHLFIYYKV